MQRSFLGQVMTSRPCSACGGTGQQIPSPCPTCGAEGRVRARRTITVDVPAGIEDGMRIRLSGQGEVGPGGGPAGDLYIEVAEQPHDTFTREGSDLHCTIVLPMTAAALGTDLVLTTLDGEEKLDIRAGTQNGAVLTLRGQGVPRLRSSSRGDLLVHVEVRTPTRLDDAQEKLLRELAALRHEEVAVNGSRSACSARSATRSAGGDAKPPHEIGAPSGDPGSLRDFARNPPAIAVHTFGYGLLGRLASGSLDHHIWQTTSLAGH